MKQMHLGNRQKMNKAKEAAKQIWGASPAGIRYGKGYEPGTKEFFENVLAKRSTYKLPWLFDLIPFSSFQGKKVLEIGCGAGYDAYEFCRNGADYTGIDIAPENIDRISKHLSFYGYQPKLMVGDAEFLEFQDESFDVVFSNGVLHHVPDITRTLKEINRVLKPGGRFYMIVYHKNSIFYWVSLFFFEHLILLGFLKRSFKERLSMIEYTTAEARPFVKAYSVKELRNILCKADFMLENLWVRKLVEEDLPGIPLLQSLWKYIPQSFLDKVGRFVGWYIIVKAIKKL